MSITAPFTTEAAAARMLSNPSRGNSKVVELSKDVNVFCMLSMSVGISVNGVSAGEMVRVISCPGDAAVIGYR